jgi:hypothetical protein
LRASPGRADYDLAMRSAIELGVKSLHLVERDAVDLVDLLVQRADVTNVVLRIWMQASFKRQRREGGWLCLAGLDFAPPSASSPDPVRPRGTMARAAVQPSAEAPGSGSRTSSESSRSPAPRAPLKFIASSKETRLIQAISL